MASSCISLSENPPSGSGTLAVSCDSSPGVVTGASMLPCCGSPEGASEGSSTCGESSLVPDVGVSAILGAAGSVLTEAFALAASSASASSIIRSVFSSGSGPAVATA
ncbi:unnamed protein product [Ixodes pacificus]